MAELKIKTPYSGAARLVTSIPTWINEYDAQRMAAYQLYEDIYWTVRNTFKLTQRGSEENPIYLPSGRIIVNTMNRYVGKDWSVMADPAFGTEVAQKAALQLVQDFFKREKFRSQFAGAKKYGLIRGDWAFYITGNPLKPEGSRLSIKSIDPAMMFPISDVEDVDRILGVDLIEQIPLGDKVYIQKQRYLKSTHPDHPNFGDPLAAVSYEKIILEQENWETPEAKVFRTDQPIILLESGANKITNLPVYHIRNGDYEPGNPFGSSEMRGLERVMAALNQGITDEELALALDGLGMYKSAKGSPKNAAGQPVPWNLGPGKVVHDETFDRVTGVGSVTPYTEHMKFLKGEMYEASGTNDVARGIVDVAVAESGIALALRMGPIIGEAEEKDIGIQEVMDQLLFDLSEWFAVYEGSGFEDVRIVSVFGDKLPKDKQAIFDNIMTMATADPPIISHGTARDMLRAEGMEIPSDEGVNVIQELQATAEAADAAGARLANEAAGASDNPVISDSAP